MLQNVQVTVAALDVLSREVTVDGLLHGQHAIEALGDSGLLFSSCDERRMLETACDAHRMSVSFVA